MNKWNRSYVNGLAKQKGWCEIGQSVVTTVMVCSIDCTVVVGKG